jgi:hypothetical protein
MKRPDEFPAINVQEHLKIVVSEKILTKNVETVVTKTVICQRVK